jgi:hypothetical protein
VIYCFQIIREVFNMTNSDEKRYLELRENVLVQEFMRLREGVMNSMMDTLSECSDEKREQMLVWLLKHKDEIPTN